MLKMREKNENIWELQNLKRNLLCTIFAAEQRGNKLIYLIDEKLEETGKSLSLACGIHTNDPPMFPPL